MNSFTPDVPHVIQITPGKVLVGVAAAGFIALFPGYFLYHYAVSAGLMPSLLGGAFGISTAAIIACGMVPYVLTQHRLARHAGGILMMVYAFLFYVLFWMLLNNVTGSDARIVGPATQQLATATASWIALFVVGMFAPQENMVFRRVTAVFWLLTVVIALLSFDRSYLILDIRTGAADDTIATYKELARSVCYASLFLTMTMSNRAYRLALAAVSTLTLFVIGSRSEMLGFIMATVLVEALIARRSLAGYAMLGFTLLIGIYLAVQNFGFLAYTRFGTLLSLGTDQSWIRREVLNSFAWQQIQSEPVFGVYGGHFLAGDSGSYAHNALSAWVSLGLVGFVLYVAPTLYCTWLSATACWRDPQSRAWNLALAVNLISLIFIVSSQSIFWTLPALGWGLTLRARAREQMTASAAAPRRRRVGFRPHGLPQRPAGSWPRR